MTVLTTALSTDFTPTATKFALNVSGGAVEVLRRLESGTIYQSVGTVSNEGVMVDNVVGSIYQLRASFGAPTVRATE
jgi:hypothetical protein